MLAWKFGRSWMQAMLWIRSTPREGASQGPHCSLAPWPAARAVA